MTRKETKDFLHILNVNFPNSFKHIKTNKDMQGVEDMWYLGFKNQSLESMSQALMEYLSTEVNVATPSLGQLFSGMKKMVVKNIDLIEGLPGWYLETEQTPPDKQLLLEIEQIKENLRNGN